MLIADAEGRITGWSRGAERLLGCSAAKLLGQDCASIYVDEEQARHRERHRGITQAATASSFDATLKTGSGARCPARVTTVPMYDASNMPAHQLITIHAPAAPGTQPGDSRLPSPQLRETVLREVNHRINNNLQDLIAMMRLQTTQRMSPQEVTDQSVARLMAVSMAFALASQHGASIPFCDLVAGIARNAEQASRQRIPLQVSAAATHNAILIQEQNAANLALVINELVFNALQRASQDETAGGVRIFIDRGEDSAELCVVDETWQMPAGFAPEPESEACMELGLARLLLPREGCELSMKVGTGGVCAQLVLRQTMLSDVHRSLP